MVCECALQPFLSQRHNIGKVSRHCHGRAAHAFCVVAAPNSLELPEGVRRRRDNKLARVDFLEVLPCGGSPLHKTKANRTAQALRCVAVATCHTARTPAAERELRVKNTPPDIIRGIKRAITKSACPTYLHTKSYTFPTREDHCTRPVDKLTSRTKR